MSNGIKVGPMIIGREEHCISRRNIAPNALKVLYRLHNHGYVAYLVGGSVRDLLIGKKPKDFDVVTDARPNQVRKLFGSSRIIGRRFKLAHIFFRGRQIIEVSTFRKKSEFSPKDKNSLVNRSENTYGEPIEDAHRRDLTINGLYYNIDDYTIIDYVGGLSDIENRVINVIGDAKERLFEDPVRMIRVLRHTARTGFDIDPAVYSVIKKNHNMIKECSAPRVREEFMRELRGGWAGKSFSLALETGMINSMFPPYQEHLNGPRGEKVRQALISNMGGIDKIILSGKEISDSELLAAFISPLVIGCDLKKNLPPGKKAISMYNRRIRDTLKPLLRETGFSRGYSESVCHMLFAQHLLFQALGKGALPKSLVNKNYFGPGLRLYQIEGAGQGRATPKMFIKAARGKKVDLLVKPRKKPRRKASKQRRKPHPKTA